MDYFDEVSLALKELKKHNDVIKKISNIINEKHLSNSKILVAGNGGSNADASHFVGELVCTFINRSRKPINAIDISSNSTEMTAWSNDFSFETYIERKVDAHGQEGDIAFFISTGGGNNKDKSSLNLVNACRLANKNKLTTISLVGKSGGILNQISDVSILVESNVTSVIQECHMSILHKICYQLEDLI